MRVVFFGSGEFGLPTLAWLAQSEHHVALVVTQPARGAGRGRKVTSTPVGLSAAELGLDVLEAEDVNTPEVLARIQAADARLGLAIAFGQKIKRAIRTALPAGCLNLHASLLPRYRGAAPINWAIVNGEEKTGVTVFKLVGRMDAGPILTTRWTYIKPEETAGELHDRLAGIGVDAVQAAFELFSGGSVPEGVPQEESQATTAPKLTKRSGWIDFKQPASRVCFFIQGMTPWPGATARFRSQEGRWEQVAIVRARPVELPQVPAAPPGTIDKRLYVAAVDQFIELLELKPASGRIMSWQEYVNGRHVRAGDQFTTPM